mgnify:CR=1 FL=1
MLCYDPRIMTREDTFMQLLKEAAAILLFLPALQAGEETQIDFVKQVKPILEKRCLSCHGSEKQKGKLRLDLKGAAMEAGNKGNVILPGNAEESALFQRINLDRTHDDIMPLKGDPLSETELETIRAWIAQGAKWPDDLVLKPAVQKVEEAKASSVPSLHERIDALIRTRLKGKVAPGASDKDFLRRVYLDFAGTIPSAKEAATFLVDKSPDKRTKLLDTLMNGPGYGRAMANAFSVMLLERRVGRDIPGEEWHRYLESAFEGNKPWDVLMQDILAAEGTDPRNRPAVKFYLERGQLTLLTSDISRLMLGRDISCAQCHDHPSIKDYTQAEFYGLMAYLSGSRRHVNKATKKVYYLDGHLGKKLEFKSAFTQKKAMSGPKLAHRAEIRIPVFQGGREYAPVVDHVSGMKTRPKFQRRKLLAAHLPSVDNEAFRKNAVNRLWFMLMGRGLVQPLDQHHPKNPASHPELLELLAAEFQAMNFDIKEFLRELALTQSYQRSSLLPEGVSDVPPESYAVFNMRPLSAEQLAWSVMQSTENLAWVQSKPKREAAAAKARERATAKAAKKAGKDPKSAVKKNEKEEEVKEDPLDPDAPKVLELFRKAYANPPGEAEGQYNPSTVGALFLGNEKLILHWLKPHQKNMAARLTGLAKQKKFEKIADELYLAVLSRHPLDEEKVETVDYLKKDEKRFTDALAEYAWSLLASTEFRMNH